jgi:hypothetical protein
MEKDLDHYETGGFKLCKWATLVKEKGRKGWRVGGHAGESRKGKEQDTHSDGSSLYQETSNIEIEFSTRSKCNAS